MTEIKKNRHGRLAVLIALLLLLILFLALLFAYCNLKPRGIYEGRIMSTLIDQRPLSDAAMQELIALDVNEDGIPDYQQYGEITARSEYDMQVLYAFQWICENLNDVKDDGTYEPEQPPAAYPDLPPPPSIDLPPVRHPSEAGTAAVKPPVPPSSAPESSTPDIAPSLPEESSAISSEASLEDTVWIPAGPSNAQPPHITGITVQKLPEKTAYIEDERFDPAGMEVVYRKSDGATAPVTAYRYPTEPLKLGTESVEISVPEGSGGEPYTATFPITVREKVLQAITVELLEGKEYIEGQTPHKDDFVARGEYDNGRIYPLPGVEVPETPLGKEQTELAVTVTADGKSETVTVPIAVREKSVSELKVTTLPGKTDYIEGERFDPSGLVVEAAYDNGVDKKEVPVVIPNRELAPGQTEVVASYTENGKTVTVTVPIHVREKKIVSVELSAPPDRSSYIEEEEFVSDGLAYVIHYDNGKSETVTDSSGLPAQTLTAGQTEVVYHIGRGDSAADLAIPVTVRPATPLELAVIAPPKKSSYIEDETFAPEGMELQARLDNGKRKPVADYTAAPSVLQMGDGHVTVSYTYNEHTVTTEVAVSVRLKSPVELRIDTPPTKTEYRNEEDYDLSGLSASVLYDNGKTYPVSGIVAKKPYPLMGDTAAKITYTENGKTVSAEFPITVTREQLTAVSVQTMPHKTTYVEETAFEPEGLSLLCAYDNGKTKITTDFTFPDAELQLGDTSVTVSVTQYGVTLSVDVPVTVTKAKPAALQLLSYPDNLSQYASSRLDLTGMTVQIRYDNGKTKTVPATDERFKLSNGKRQLDIIDPVTAVTEYSLSDAIYTEDGVTVQGESNEGSRSLRITPYLARLTLETSENVPYYKVGQALSPEGLVIRFDYAGVVTTTMRTAPCDPEAPGDEIMGLLQSGMVALRYGEDTATNDGAEDKSVTVALVPSPRFILSGESQVSVRVAPLLPESLELVTPPGKTRYVNDEPFDPTGAAFRVTYNNGRVQSLDAESPGVEIGYLDSGEFVALSQILKYRNESNLVRYTYNGATVETPLSLVIEDETPVSISRIGKFSGLSFKENTSFSPGDISYRIRFSNGKTMDVPYQTQAVSNATPGQPTPTSGQGFTAQAGPEAGTKLVAGNNADYGANTAAFQFTMNGKSISDSFDFEMTHRLVSSISATAKKTYNHNDPVSASDFDVTIQWDNGETTKAAPENLTLSADTAVNSGLTEITNSIRIGTQGLLTVGTPTCNVEITVKAPTPTKLEIISPPDKTEYIHGTKFTTNGLVLHATHTNGFVQRLTPSSPGIAISIPAGGEVSYGTASFTISYTFNNVTRQAVQGITVIHEIPTALAVAAAPSKTAYIEGNTLNLSGLSLKVTLSNGKTETLAYNSTGVSCTPAHGAVLTTANNAVTINYTRYGTTKKTAQAISVVQKSIQSIAVRTNPTKTVYTDGDAFNAAGLTLNCTYDNGTAGTISALGNMTFTPTALANNGASPVSQTVTVGLRGLRVIGSPSCTVNVTVNPAYKTCTACSGVGTVTRYRDQTCGSCGGDGYGQSRSCESCGGNGKFLGGGWYPYACTAGCKSFLSQGSSGPSFKHSLKDCPGTFVQTGGEESCITCSGTGSIRYRCSNCGGDGRVSAPYQATCDTCGGSGKVPINARSLLSLNAWGDCPSCEEASSTTGEAVVIDLDYRLPEGETNMANATYILYCEDGSEREIPYQSKHIFIIYFDDRMRVIYQAPGLEVYRDYLF